MLKSQTGSAMLLGIMVMLFLAIAGAGLLPLVTNEVRMATMNRDDLQATYAAEAGAKRALDELKQVNSADSPVLSWHDQVQALTNEKNDGEYCVSLLTSNDTKITSSDLLLASGSEYIIKSVGTVGNAKKTVYVTITVNAGSGSSSNSGNGGVFGSYTLFSNKDMNIDNTPKLQGSVGSNGKITVNSSSPLVPGAAYTPYPLIIDQWTWNKNAVTGGYVKVDSAGTLDVASLIPVMPTMPTITTSGTQITNATQNINLQGGSYYYNGNYTTGKSITAVGDQPVIIYINGNLQLTKDWSSGGSGTIQGNNVTIYANGNITLDNSSSIQANNLNIYAKGQIQFTNYSKVNANNITIQSDKDVTLNSCSAINQDLTNASSLNIYAQGSMQLTNNTFINANNVLVHTQGSINFNSNSFINKDLPMSITKIYSGGQLEFTNYFEIGGTGLVVAEDEININSNGLAKQTIFISDGGKRSEVTNSAQIAGIYTNGSLAINSSPQINANNQKDQVLEKLGLLAAGSISVLEKQGSWKIE